MKFTDKIYRNLLILVSIIFITSFFTIVIYNLWNIHKINKAMVKYEDKNSIRSILILPKNEVYWNNFITEFQSISNKYNILSTVIFYSEIGELIKAIKLSNLSSVDAVIICNIFNSTQIDDAIKQLKLKNIFVASLLNDSLYRNEDTFIGIDYYLKGKMIGNIIYENLNKKNLLAVNIAVVNSPFYSNMGGTLEIKGIVDSLKKHNIKTIDFKSFSSEYGSFSAEVIAKELISENSTFNVIYVSNQPETLTITQSVVLANKIDNFIIIGSGNDEKLLNYKKKGIITALVNDNIKMITQKLSEAIISYKKYGHASSFILTDFSILK